MRNRASLVVAFAVLGTLHTFASDARADPPNGPASSSERTGEWGFIVVASGIAVGGALTAYGLTFDCGDAARACQRRASVAIWGGIGIASLASGIGLTIVQTGRARVRMTATGLEMAATF